MHKSFRSVTPLITATAAVAWAAQSMAATLTTGVAVPFSSTTGPGSATAVTYTTLNISSMSTASTPNGGYAPTIVGTVSVSGTPSVSTAYAYDIVNGFRLIGLYTTTSLGSHTNTNVRGANNVGQVIGSSPINSSQSSDSNGILGAEAWLYSTAGNTNISLGLTGANFGYTKNVPMNGTVTPVAFSGLFRNSTPSFVNNSGTVVGSTSRYGGDSAATPSTSLGSSTWLYNGATTTEIGLTGSGYSYNATTGTGTSGRFSSNSIQGLNASGTAMGFASAYFDRGDGTATSLGQDGWVYNGATPVAVGLYQRGTDPDVGGFAAQAYKYYSVPTATVGTTPASSQLRSTSLNSINALGQVAGTSQYYTASSPGVAGGFKGTDGFVYTPSTGTYRQVGFFQNTGNFSNGVLPPAPSSSFVSNSGARGTSINSINNAGKTVGTSTQYFYYNNASNVSTPATGQAAWIDDGTTTTRIGLYGQVGDPLPTMHVNPQTGVSSSSITNLTQSGLVGGFSARYFLNGTTGTTGTQFGQDAWVYDSNTGTINLVNPTNAAGNVFTSSSISYLSEDGFAVGLYSVSTTTASTGSFNKAFLWSLAGGFVDLGASISPSLSSQGYQNLITAYYSSAAGGTIYASASLNGSNTTIGALVAITGVPEPTSMAVLAVGGLAALRRQRSRSA